MALSDSVDANKACAEMLREMANLVEVGKDIGTVEYNKNTIPGSLQGKGNVTSYFVRVEVYEK